MKLEMGAQAKRIADRALAGIVGIRRQRLIQGPKNLLRHSVTDCGVGAAKASRVIELHRNPEGLSSMVHILLY